MSEDDAVRRREARRLKILARSGDRMDKIMGVSTNNTNDTPTSLAGSQILESKQAEKPFALDTLMTSPSTHTQLLNLQELNASTERLLEAAQKEEEERTLSQVHHQVNNNPLPPQLANLLQNLQGQDPTLEGEQPTTESENKTFYKIRTILSFLLGIFIRLSFLTSLGAIYVQSALNPFVAFEVAVIGYQKSVGMALHPRMKGGGMWMSALALSGVNQNVINSYSQVMGLVTTILDDLTVYFFAFTVTHLCADPQYWSIAQAHNSTSLH